MFTEQYELSLYTRTCRGADKSLARPTSRCILFGGENISFGASLVIRGLSGKYPAIFNISRTGRVTLM